MAQKKRTPFRPPQKHLQQKPLQKNRGTPEELAEFQLQERRAREQEPDLDAEDPAAESRPAARSTRTPVSPVVPKAEVVEERSDKLHKVLAQAGVGSRRDMEAAVAAGRVSVNGKPADLGQRVSPSDRILFDNRPIRKPKPDQLPRILIYHKLEGEIVSHDDPGGRSSVFEKLPRLRGAKWVSVGRLDFNTSGLLIFTTSGELANRLSHPRFEVEREYAVRVMGELSKEQCEMLCKGVELEDGPAKFEWLRGERPGEGSNHWYRVMLREGRNREVRRMFELMNVMVSRLMRVRFGMINMPPRLKRGSLLELDLKQVRSVLEWA
ncbi:MAG TPA: pseudouridine synthase, partial [Burkholderiales bacterium]|nr:pseudouridine synthase [Burkholderiales bacterium]